MKIIRHIKELNDSLYDFRRQGASIGLVPTMGFLHEGHMSLVNKSVADNDVTVVSIFVNPIQFGPNEDLEKYPRDIERDESLLVKAGADYVFYPDVKEMYPEGFSTKITVSGVSCGLCGGSRPGHFDGVATVVTKLFNIVRPNNAYFGMKDYQQLAVIKRFVKDLNMDSFINIIGMPIVRERDGLALSSRNVYLSEDDRKSAVSMHKSFGIIDELIRQGVRDKHEIINAVKAFIESYPGVKIDYAEIREPVTLEEKTFIDGDFMLMLAIFVGSTRLIDNRLFSL